jgi:hypothetical protein
MSHEHSVASRLGSDQQADPLRRPDCITRDPEASTFRVKVMRKAMLRCLPGQRLRVRLPDSGALALDPYAVHMSEKSASR